MSRQKPANAGNTGLCTDNWARLDSNQRRQSQRIYSPSRLTTSVHARFIWIVWTASVDGGYGSMASLASIFKTSCHS